MEREEKWLLEEKYGGEKSAGFFTDLKRLETGEPLAYVIGHAPFLDCVIHLDSKPLIPRAETEFWVEKAIKDIKNQELRGPTPESGVGPLSLRILDLCAGSGAIGVAVAKAVPTARVDFSEIDPSHLSTIKKNLLENIPNYSNRLDFFKIAESDLFENIEGKFDFILCNPPYIDPLIDRVQPSVKNYEPRQALYGGPKGLDLIERVINETPDRLTKNGVLYIEHEPEQSETIANLAAKQGLAANVFLDQYGIERYSRLSR